MTITCSSLHPEIFGSLCARIWQLNVVLAKYSVRQGSFAVKCSSSFSSFPALITVHATLEIIFAAVYQQGFIAKVFFIISSWRVLQDFLRQFGSFFIFLFLCYFSSDESGRLWDLEEFRVERLWRGGGRRKIIVGRTLIEAVIFIILIFKNCLWLYHSNISCK